MTEKSNGTFVGKAKELEGRVIVTVEVEKGSALCLSRWKFDVLSNLNVTEKNKKRGWCMAAKGRSLPVV